MASLEEAFILVSSKFIPALTYLSFAAVIRVVTQRFSPTGGETLRDDPNNGCKGDYYKKHANQSVIQANLIDIQSNRSSDQANRSAEFHSSWSV